MEHGAKDHDLAGADGDEGLVQPRDGRHARLVEVDIARRDALLVLRGAGPHHEVGYAFPQFRMRIAFFEIRRFRYPRSPLTIREFAETDHGLDVRDQRLGHARAESETAMLPLENRPRALLAWIPQDVESHAGDLDDVIPQFGGLQPILFLSKGRDGVFLVGRPDVRGDEGGADVFFW